MNYSEMTTKEMLNILVDYKNTDNKRWLTDYLYNLDLHTLIVHSHEARNYFNRDYMAQERGKLIFNRFILKHYEH